MHDVDDDLEDTYKDLHLLIGNWYYYLEQPWDYKDLLLEYGIDLDTQWTFGMIVYDLLRGHLDVSSLEAYLGIEREEEVPKTAEEIMQEILDIYWSDSGELLDNEQTAFLIDNEITESVLWELLSNGTSYETWEDEWPEMDEEDLETVDETVVAEDGTIDGCCPEG